jgi:tetratricopeptide (TPR) repeat protein
VVRNFKLGLFLVLAAFLAWRIIMSGMSEYYATDDSTEAGAQALAWNPDHPVGLWRAAEKWLPGDPARAEVLLRQAIAVNPADGRDWMALAQVYEKRQDDNRAMLAVERATTLSPMQSSVQLAAGVFWLRHDRPDIAIDNLDRVMRVRGNVEGKIYPILLRIAENPQSRSLFDHVIKNDPPWWHDFYNYAAAHSQSLDTILDLYRARQKALGNPVAEERKPLLARLQKEGRWLDAYFVWLNSRTREQIGGLGNLYNGNFELGISNEGFDWIAPATRGAKVSVEESYGSTGTRALHVELDGLRLRFAHLYQYLMLDPGKYYLRGRVRVDNLQAVKGMQWMVRCVSPSTTLIGSSELFVGTEQWRHFSTPIVVPEQGCPVQMLRLELAGQAELDFVAEGSIWFDDLEIGQENH